MSASELIRQFREGKPTSRADREAMRGAGQRPESLWWSPNGSSSAVQRRHQEDGRKAGVFPDFYNEKGEDTNETSGGAEPRLSSSLKLPEPRIGSTLNKQERVSQRRTPQERLQRYEGTTHCIPWAKRGGLLAVKRWVD